MYNAILEVTVKCAQIVKTHPSFNGPVFLFSYLEWSERKATMGSAQVVSGSDSPYCVRRRMHACPCMRAYMCMCMFACVATRAVSNVRVDGCTHTCTVQSHVRLFCERMFMRRRTPDGLMAHLADNGYEPLCSKSVLRSVCKRWALDIRPVAVIHAASQFQFGVQSVLRTNDWLTSSCRMYAMYPLLILTDALTHWHTDALTCNGSPLLLHER
jgi:hypothetical protein